MESVKNPDGTYKVVDDSGATLQDGFKNKKAADAAQPELEKAATEARAKEDEDEDGGPEATEPEEEEKTVWNPFGLNIHQRFAQLLHTLSRQGIKHAESAHPAQNAQTTSEKFATKAKTGQNSLPAQDKQLTPVEAVSETE